MAMTTTAPEPRSPAADGGGANAVPVQPAAPTRAALLPRPAQGGGRLQKLFGGWEWKLFWWAMMVAAIFWTLVYRLGQSDGRLPDFVYVNF